MKRLGFSYKQLYEIILKEEKYFKGLEFTVESDITLKNILWKYGHFLLGKYCTSISYDENNQDERINLIHVNDINDSEDFKNDMNKWGYRHLDTKILSEEEKILKNIPKKYNLVYFSTYEGIHATQDKLRILCNMPII
jgi:hypothetical protein